VLHYIGRYKAGQQNSYGYSGNGPDLALRDYVFAHKQGRCRSYDEYSQHDQQRAGDCISEYFCHCALPVNYQIVLA